MGKSERLMRMIEESIPGYFNFPLEIQLESLGLDDEKISELKGARVIDFGCGEEGTLVRFLRERGIDAFGIDPRAPDENYFFRKMAGVGDTPLEENSYDLVTAHSVSPIRTVLTNHVLPEPEGDSAYEKDRFRGRMMFLEMADCLRGDGEMIFYPAVGKIEEILPTLIGAPEISYSHIHVDLRRGDRNFSDYIRRQGILFGAGEDRVKKAIHDFMYRTVATKA